MVAGKDSETSAQTTARVWQIFYAPWQRERLDPAFLAYDNSDSAKPGEHEFHVFRKEYLAGTTQEGLSGFVSWKFEEKTGLSGKEWLAYCASNPGRDVYFVNPYPIEICYGNIWRQGEMWTPGITAIAQELLDRCGYGIDLQRMPQRLQTLAFCNYWMGTPAFWKRYMDFCLPIYNEIQNNPDDPLCSKLQTLGDPGRGASYFSFIFERLFSTLLAVDRSITYAAYPYSRHQLLKRHPSGYGSFLADLQELERSCAQEEEPIRQSARHQRFLARQQWRMKLMNHEWIRRRFNRNWPRWQQSALRRKLIHHRRMEQLEMEIFHLLNPGYVHWRRDLPGRS